MQSTVEKVSDVIRKMTISLPMQDVDRAYDKKIADIAKTADIKGFRRGKAPASFIKQRYGQSAYMEALNELLQKTTIAALEGHQLTPVSRPAYEPVQKTETGDGEDAPKATDLEFIVTFEVLPSITDINFKLDTVEKLNVEITPADVDHVVEQLRKQNTKWEKVDRAAADGDRAVINFSIYIDGAELAEESSKGENFPLEIGSKTMVPGFEEGLIGKQAGDQFVLPITMPAAYHAEHLAGKAVEFHIQLKQVLTANMPALDAAFFKKLGIKEGSEAEARAQIEQSLQQERDRLVQEKLKSQVFTQLIEQNTLDVPSSLIENEAKRIHDEIYPDHQPHDHQSHDAAELQSYNEIAKKRVLLSLLVSEYAKRHALTADPKQVAEKIEMIAALYEHPAQVREWLSTAERRGGIESQVVEEQVIAHLLTNVPVNEKVIPYAELKGQGG